MERNHEPEIVMTVNNCSWVRVVTRTFGGPVLKQDRYVRDVPVVVGPCYMLSASGTYQQADRGVEFSACFGKETLFTSDGWPWNFYQGF